MKRITALLVLAITFCSFAQNKKPAYVLYNGQGEEVAYSELIKKAGKSNFVFFGELHNNPISHWLEYEITVDLGKKNDLILSAEMFEQDNQEALTQYIKGEITKEAFDTLARFWPNYKTDYQALVEYAKANKLQFIAANIPRRYANQVYHGGFEALEALSVEEKSWIAPLPIAYDSSVACYQNILKMSHGHGGTNLPKAQAIKDATMAHFIIKNYEKGKTLIHYNGAYHSDFYEGIVWWLKKAEQKKILTISTILQKDISTLNKDNMQRADFIICVDEDMTTTY